MSSSYLQPSNGDFLGYSVSSDKKDTVVVRLNDESSEFQQHGRASYKLAGRVTLVLPESVMAVMYSTTGEVLKSVVAVHDYFEVAVSESRCKYVAFAGLSDVNVILE